LTPLAQHRTAKTRVAIVQQGVWAMEKESLPLAAGYLKATLLADDRIRSEAEVQIHNFKGGITLGALVRDILVGGLPDILALSVFGWNVAAFAAISDTYRQLRPDGIVIWGGTHVAYQAERMVRLAPSVDIFVNGEGEFILRDLVQAYLANGNTPEFWSAIAEVPGISTHHEGTVAETSPPVRIADINTIPSPFLTGAVPLVDANGVFRYDVALIETNRGCPYKCAFCYWGGATGQKVRAFDRDRLREEVEMFAQLGVESLVMCDANFGLLKPDLGFIEDVIAIKERYGFPRNVDTSWAKNKSETFYEIVRRMAGAGLRSSFTLALQTMSDEALALMRRKNMKLNDWEEMVEFMNEQGLDLYGELIWGAPGEGRDDFLDGYNRLSRHTSRIAVYPLLILPNTAYHVEREDLGLITVRGEQDDFEYVLATKDMSLDENITGQPFLLLARTLGEHMILRYTWHALRELCQLDQGSALWSLGEHVRTSSHPVAVALRALLSDRTVVDSSAVGSALRVLYATEDVDGFLLEWLEQSVRPTADAKAWTLLLEVFRFDWCSRPLLETEDWLTEPLTRSQIEGTPCFKRDRVPFAFALGDVFSGGETSAAGALRECLGTADGAEPPRYAYDFVYPDGFSDHIDSHELAAHYFAVVTSSPEGPPQDWSDSPAYAQAGQSGPRTAGER
jgi:radical SAM superfamily enzyme YgiQ (UPF0313 family)